MRELCEVLTGLRGDRDGDCVSGRSLPCLCYVQVSGGRRRDGPEVLHHGAAGGELGEGLRHSLHSSGEEREEESATVTLSM